MVTDPHNFEINPLEMGRSFPIREFSRIQEYKVVTVLSNPSSLYLSQQYLSTEMGLTLIGVLALCLKPKNQTLVLHHNKHQLCHLHFASCSLSFAILSSLTKTALWGSWAQFPTSALLSGILTPSRTCLQSLLAAHWQISPEVPWQPCFKPYFCPLPPSCFPTAEASSLFLPCRALIPNNEGGISVCALCL